MFDQLYETKADAFEAGKRAGRAELEAAVERMRQTLFWIAHAEVDRHYPSAETLRGHARKALDDLAL
jgi:hypothetical protein